MLLLEYKILECRCLQKLERIDEAIDRYKNVAKMFPGDPRALLILSEIYLTQYDFDKNKELLEKAREIDNDFWLINLIELVRKSYLDEEIDVSNIDESTCPDSPGKKSSFYRVFSSILEKSGDQTRAESFIEKAIYCPYLGMGEKPSPSGEDFSRLAAWKITARHRTAFMI